MARKMYVLREFERDWIGAGFPAFTQVAECNKKLLLAPLLDSCFEVWVDRLVESDDVVISIMPHCIVRRTTEIICVFDGKVLKIKNDRDLIWESINGNYYFTGQLELFANHEKTIDRAIMSFRQLLQHSDLGLLKIKTRKILDGLSPAFVHQMPQEIQDFFFPGV